MEASHSICIFGLDRLRKIRCYKKSKNLDYQVDKIREYEFSVERKTCVLASDG